MTIPSHFIPTIVWAAARAIFPLPVYLRQQQATVIPALATKKIDRRFTGVYRLRRLGIDFSFTPFSQGHNKADSHRRSRCPDSQ
jgi:hypothetical protein